MSEMFCTECRQVLPAGAKFCTGCGHPVGGGSRPATGANWLRDGLIIMVLIVVVIGGFGGYRLWSWYMQKTPPPTHEAIEMSSPADHEGMGASLTNVPTDYTGLVNGGNQYMDAGNFPMAAEYYGRAMKIDGSSPDVRTDYGACLHAMGLAERGLDEFRTVYLEHPEHTIVRYNMGIVHYGLGRVDSAKQYWEEFLSFSPEGNSAESARVYLEQIGQ